MDSHEAARAVFTRIQRLDPDNAHKIVGYILLQDQAEKEMIRLAFGPDNLIHSVIARAKSQFGLSSNTSPAPNFSTPPFTPTPRLSHNGFNSPPPSIWSISASDDSLSSLPDYSLDDNMPSHGRRRSSSGNEICFETDEPCHNYFSTSNVDSPCKFDAFDQYQQEVLRSKVAQQQRLAAAQYMAGLNSPHNKFSFLQREAQRSAVAAALMMEDEMRNLNRFRIGRNDVSEMGSVSRQIYLTFPADSTFKEEDVSNYFSIYGPVQDVRIPHQQKRMFGFVTFLYPETVRIILAKGNPHFVCDSRVLVKPYKEKGKLTDKKHQMDRYEFSSCSSPSGLDREPFNMHVGPRMFNNNQEMLRKKLEQELCWEQALEFQRRRIINLQLDLKNHQRYQYEHDAFVGSPPHSASNHKTFINQSIPPTATNVFLDDALEENQRSPTASPTKKPQEDDASGNEKDNSDIKASNVPESVSASPKKSAAEDQSIFAPKPVETGNGVTVATATASTLNMAPPKSYFHEIPCFSSEHGAIGM